MKRIFSLGLTVAVLSAGMVSAETRQTGVIGPSENEAYPLRVQASDGAVYNCKKEITTNAEGKRARSCIPEGTDGSVFAAGEGLTNGAAVGAIALAVVAVAAGSGGGGSSATTTGSGENASDIRLKTDIIQVGTTSMDLPLYHFRYTGGTQVFEGVMAQDVQRVMPEAVVTMDNGFLGVHYDMLGIEMYKIN